MQKYKLLINLLMSIIFIVLLSTNISAFFTESHLSWTIDGFNSIQSPITQECTPYLAEFLDGNTGADLGVLYYGSSNNRKLGSYIYPHTIGAFNTCLREAGSDLGLKCFCLGQYTHVLQDSYAHNQGGLVEKYLKKYVGQNYWNHMVIEQNFQLKHKKYLAEKGSYAISSGKEDYYNSIVLNTLFPETGGDSKYMQMVNNMAGIDMENTAQIFRSNYQAEGFYNAVYKDKTELPLWFYLISVGLAVLGIIMAIFMWYIGRTGWKWVSVIMWILIAIAGIILVISLFTGKSWIIATAIIEIPPKFGYSEVTDGDIAKFDTLVQQATNNFLTTGNPSIQDASGLTYIDKSGKEISGALTNAEKPFRILMYAVVFPLSILINIWLIWKALVPKKKKNE